MEIRPEQLASNLNGGIYPIYLIGGDEPLLSIEATDYLRGFLRQQDFSGTEVIHIDRASDWDAVIQAMDSLSLFSEKRLVEVRLPSCKPEDRGSRVIGEYLERRPEDVVLLIRTGKVDAAAKKSKWMKAVNEHGVIVISRQIRDRALFRWTEKRFEKFGISASAEAVQILNERAEGNLLACAQEIEKLALTTRGKRVTAEDVAAVSDSARYNVFMMVDSALEGDAARCIRFALGLKQEGVHCTLVIWALSRELRSLAGIARVVGTGVPIDAAIAKAGVWASRRTLVRKALQRLSVQHWLSLLERCSMIDRCCKGQVRGNPWLEVVNLLLAVTGRDLGLWQAA